MFHVPVKISCILVCMFAICFSDTDNVGNFNIGAAAGYSTGLGLSYRQWIGKWGIQITTAPFYSSDDELTRSFLSLGVTTLRKIKEARVVNLFSYVGAHGFYYRYDYHAARKKATYDDYHTDTYYEDKLTKKIIIGAGPGLDFHSSRISISLMCGIAGGYDIATEKPGVNMTGEIALYYSF